eukprot:1711800-Amphidinium_carterae.1
MPVLDPRDVSFEDCRMSRLTSLHQHSDAFTVYSFAEGSGELSNTCLCHQQAFLLCMECVYHELCGCWTPFRLSYLKACGYHRDHDPSNVAATGFGGDVLSGSPLHTPLSNSFRRYSEIVDVREVSGNKQTQKNDRNSNNRRRRRTTNALVPSQAAPSKQMRLIHIHGSSTGGVQNGPWASTRQQDDLRRESNALR